jgi:hypothetical protein
MAPRNRIEVPTTIPWLNGGLAAFFNTTNTTKNFLNYLKNQRAREKVPGKDISLKAAFDLRFLCSSRLDDFVPAPADSCPVEIPEWPRTRAQAENNTTGRQNR